MSNVLTFKEHLALSESTADSFSFDFESMNENAITDKISELYDKLLGKVKPEEKTKILDQSDEMDDKEKTDFINKNIENLKDSGSWGNSVIAMWKGISKSKVAARILILLTVIIMASSCRVAGGFSFHPRGGSGAVCQGGRR